MHDMLRLQNVRVMNKSGTGMCEKVCENNACNLHKLSNVLTFQLFYIYVIFDSLFFVNRVPCRCLFHHSPLGEYEI